MKRRLGLATACLSLLLVAGCNTIVDKPVGDISKTKDYVDTLKLERDASATKFRRYPITIAFAPLRFLPRVITDNEGNAIPPRIGTPMQYSQQPLRDEKEFTAQKLPGAEIQEFLTDEQSRVRPDRKDQAENFVADSVDEATDTTSDSEAVISDTGEPESTGPDSSGDPSKTGDNSSDEPKTAPDSSESKPKSSETPGLTPTRRVLLGQIQGQPVYVPLGLNSDEFETELNRRLYGPGSSAGYGGATGEGPVPEPEDTGSADSDGENSGDSGTDSESGATAEVTELKPSFTKENEVRWGEQTTADQSIAELPGFQFSIEPSAFTSRMKAVVDQFALFEETKELSGNFPNFRSVIEAADNRYADFVMTTTISRYKVAYHGVKPLNYAGSVVTYLLFWFPAIWMADEEFKVHLDVQVDINDVRSQSLVWTSQFKIEKEGVYSDAARGWKPFSNYVTPYYESYHGESAYRNVAQENLTALAWEEFERQLIEKLHNAFRTEIFSKSYQDKINDNVVPRSEGLVVGISKYGANAAQVLADFHQRSLQKASGNDQYSLADFRADAGDKNVEFGVKTYAEKDAGQVSELLKNGQDVEIPAAYLTKLFGQQATRAELLTRLHRLTRARANDRTFVYLNMETVLVDVGTEYSADGLAKFLLPYDCDLNELESRLAQTRGQLATIREQRLGGLEAEIREKRKKQLEAKGADYEELGREIDRLTREYKAGCRQILKDNEELLNSFRNICLDFFDQNAISFAWLEKQFNRDTTRPLEDLVFLQSRNVALILDTTFPGQFTDLNYAPKFELSLGAQPISIVNATTQSSEKDPANAEENAENNNGANNGENPENNAGNGSNNTETVPVGPGEIEVNNGTNNNNGENNGSQNGAQNNGSQDNSKSNDKSNSEGTKPEETKPEGTPEKKERRVRLGYLEAMKRTFVAVAQGKEEDSVANAVAQVEQQAFISNAFLKVLLRPGFIIVVSSMSSNRPLEVPSKEMGAFAYHMTRGATTEDRVTPRVSFNESGQRVLQTGMMDVLGYVARKVGRESRALGRPQEYGVFRKNKSDDFVLVQRTEQR